MKLIRCDDCGQPIALTYTWANCECGLSGGAYMPNGDSCVVAGTCGLYGIDNRLFFGLRVEAFPYDETKTRRDGTPKVVRLEHNPGSFPERVAGASR